MTSSFPARSTGGWSRAGCSGREPVLELFHVHLRVRHQAVVVPLLLHAGERGVPPELAVVERVVPEAHVAELQVLVLVAERQRGCGDPPLAVDGGESVA